MPSTIPNSKNFWYVKLNELLAMSCKLGRTPDIFLTLTQNDGWPEAQAVFKDGVRARAKIDKKENRPVKCGDNDAVLHPYERVETFTNKVLHDKKGLLGEVEDYWYRIEYQSRGGLHVHLVAWCKPDTIPENVISAKCPDSNIPTTKSGENT